jgi:zinc protease
MRLALFPPVAVPGSTPSLAGGDLPPDTLQQSSAGFSVPYTAFKLPNGLEVVIHEDHRVPIAAVVVMYHTGSGREEPGKTGLAHLFEHVMFEGSANVPRGAFDLWLEQAGGSNNGGTNQDYTSYEDVVPSNALELALFLEADRLGTLLETLDQGKLDVQRDVVKNERRERYDNAPYGLSVLLIQQALWPADHPYHRSTIGSMSDLSAASLEDVRAFFRRWYIPADATLVVAGDVDPDSVRALVEKHFGGIPGGPEPPPFYAPPARLEAERRLLLEDDVQLPRLYADWISPAFFAPGYATCDVLAILLAGGKSSRLYRRLVYELQVAQDVAAYQSSGKVGSRFEIRVTARSGHGLDEVLGIVDEELERLRREPPDAREVERAVNLHEAGFLDGLESALGRASALAANDLYADDPGYSSQSLAAHRAVTGADLQEAARRILSDRRVLLSIVPRGKPDLAARGSEPAREENP